MAGLGRKVFTAGDVLTASDVQNYLMDQTVMNFAGTAARSSAIATPTTGMTTYNQTTQQLETYNGSAYIGMSGLQLVKKQTIGSAVSSVTVTGAFSAVYENYKIIVSGGVGSATADLSLKMGATATGYYVSGYYINAYGPTGVVNSVSVANGSSLNIGTTSTNATSGDVEIQSPNLAKRTMFSMRGAQASTSGITFNTNAFLNDATQYTEFTLTPASGTLTGGTIYVYGYGV